MSNDLLYFLGFISLNLIFLILFPYYIGLNAATNLNKPFKYIEVKEYLLRLDRFIIGILSIVAFAISLFVLENGELAIILGFLISAGFVVLDYKRIYSGNGEG